MQPNLSEKIFSSGKIKQCVRFVLIIIALIFDVTHVNAQLVNKQTEMPATTHTFAATKILQEPIQNTTISEIVVYSWEIWLALAVLIALLLIISWLYVLASRRSRLALKTSRELWVSQQRLQYAMEGSSLALWDYDVASEEIYLSEEWSQLMGQGTGAGVISATEFRRLIHPEDVESVNNILNAVLMDQDCNYQCRYRICAPDGNWKWIMCYGKVVERDADGKPLRMTGTIADISSQQRMQEELHTSENRWRFALEGSNEGVWDWNLVTDEVFFSPRWKEMLGYEKDEICDNLEEWESRVHPDDLDGCYRDMNRHINHETDVYENEQRMRCKDGSYRWILARGKVIEWDNQGKPMRMIGTHLDITEKRRIQETLRLQARAMEASVDGILIADATLPDMPIVYCNSAFEQMTGFSREEVLGRNCRFLHRQDREQTGLHEIRVAQHAGLATTALLRNYRKDGTLFWNELSISPVHNEDHRLTHFIGIAHDVTERFQAEQALKHENEFSTAAINALPGTFFVLDRHGKILRMNENVSRITGFSDSELEKIDTLSFFAPEDRSLISTKISDCYKYGNAQCEARVLTKTGEQLPFYLQAEIQVLDGEKCLIGTGLDISNLKRVQQALVHSQSLLNTIVEHIPAMVFLKRASDLSYVLLNKAGEDILEYKRDEVLDRNDMELFLPEQAEAMRSVDRKVLENRSAIVLPESKFCSRSGWVRYLYTIKTALYDEKGVPTHLLGIAVDISERKHAETKLKTSEQQLKEAQRIANLGHWSMDFVKDQLEWSDEIYRIFGQEKDRYSPSYENFFAVVHPEDVDLLKQSDLNVMGEGDLYSLDHRIVRPDGEIRWVHEEARMSCDVAGKPVKLVGTVQDITARKLYEHAMRYSEARLRTILQSAVDGIIIIDGYGVIESVNPAADKIFGYETGELVGRNVSMLMPDPDRSSHDSYLQHYQATGDAHIIGVGREVVGQRKDGTTFPMDLAVSEINLNERRMFTGFIRDISVRKQVETELLTAKQQAEQANRAKSEFLANMSHELRTPMNAILGFAQLLDVGDPPLAQSQQQDVKEILRAGQHLLKLINELLDLARIEAGQMDISIEPVVVRVVMNECLQMIEPMLLKHDVILKADAEIACNYVVLADENRLRQALLNLLSNAVKYNRPGGTVIVECQSLPDNRIKITVEDTGIGIRPEKHVELFNTFSRLDAEDSATEGTGIGLAITRRLMELMHGEIGLESSPGTGSRFWLELPAADLQVLESSANVESTTPTPTMQSNQTILYIEDNPANLRFMSHLLARQSDLRLLTANEPKEGLKLAQTQHPDLILLDINLPDMDGYEVLDHLQAGQSTRNIPVIAVSANAMPDDIQRALEAGFKEYCTKPIDIYKFQLMLDTILKE